LPRIKTLRRLPKEFGLAAAAGLAGVGRNRAFDVAQVSLQGTGGELHARRSTWPTMAEIDRPDFS
jgi:hypothetical protein